MNTSYGFMKKIIFVLITLMFGVCCQAQTVVEADSLHQRGRELLNSGQIVEGRECTRQAMEMRKKLLGEVNEDYITSLNNYAYSYLMENNFAKAVELQEQVIALCGKLKVPHKDVGLYTTNLGRYYYQVGDALKAAKMWEQALPLVEKHGEIYEFLLNSLGSVYGDTGDSRNLNRILALMEEHNQHELTKPCNDPKCMMERAEYYGSTGDNAKAKQCYQAAIDMNPDDETKLSIFEAYAWYLAMTERDMATGAEYQQQAALLRKKINGEDADFARSIYSAGLFYSYSMTESGFESGLVCFDMALNTFAHLDNAPKVADCWQMKGLAYGGLKNFGKAKECYMQALAYYEQYDKESDNYPKMIERVAAMEKFNKEYEASIEHYHQAMALFDERGMMQEYGNAENALKLCLAYAGKSMDEASDGKNAEAVKEAERKKLDSIINGELANLDLYRTYLGKLMYARSLATIAGCYAMKEDFPNAVDFYKQYLKTIREAVQEEFRFESESERMHTWNNELSAISELQELLLTLPDSMSHLRDDLATMMYDARLLSKGILLNSSIEFEKLIISKNDSHLTEIYNQTKANRSEIDRLRAEASSEEDLEKIITLTQENQRLQTRLNQGFDEMDSFTNYIAYDWKNVQDCLGEDDVSIEFATVNLGLGTTPSHMVALVLSKSMQHPEAVVLWDEDDLAACDDDELNKQLINASINGDSVKDALNQARRRLNANPDVSLKSERALYLDLLEHKADTTHGVFTPILMPLVKYQDLLQQDSVMFLNQDVSDIVWGRLSSYLQGKKRIFFSADGILNNMAIEYLPYGANPLSELFDVYRLSSTKELCYKHEKVTLKKAALFGDINYNEGERITEATIRSLDVLRSSDGLANLDNTLREVNEILSILKSKGVKDSSRFHDSQASKSVFMKLSDSKINLLHVATHGIYSDAQKSSDAESMKNSQLAFAGANMGSDGFVSAAEISMMNLRYCDLAVLSACETGLGRLGSDGVFGLQRGFKNAGVHSLLMSLRNVPDGPTADLMICFYKYLMDGFSKRQALVKAQQDVKAMGYSDPKYWATFILLDSLD